MFRTVVVLFYLALIAKTSCLTAQNYISYDWQIQYGDSAQWYAKNFKPVNWKPYNIGVSWDWQRLHGPGDYVCYRNAFRLPADAQDTLLLKVHIPVEYFEVFINGRSLGKTDYRYSTAYFLLTKRSLHKGENTIAIRTYKRKYTGGDAKDTVSLGPAAKAAKMAFNISFPTADHVFHSPKTISIPIHLFSSFSEAVEGRLSVLVVSDAYDTLYRYHRPATIGYKGYLKHPVAFSGLSPGFYQVIASFSGLSNHCQKTAWFAVAPEQINAPVDSANDFSLFWQKTIAELAATPPEFSMTQVDSLSTPSRRVYSVEMQSWGNATIRGWYSAPAKPGKYPAAVDLPGYSVSMNPAGYYNDPGFIKLALDIRGHGRSRDQIDPGFGMPGYLGSGLENPNRYIYRGAIMDALRAIDFLYSRPEVDTARIAVYGVSQGGGLALAAAALYPHKVDLCVTAAPFLSDFGGYIHTRPIFKDQLGFYASRMKNRELPDVLETLSYFDVKNMADRVAAPTLMISALYDDVCPPRNNFAVYNKLAGYREYIIYPNHSHALPYSWNAAAHTWMRRMFDMD